ncbi:MAG: nuclear transport factor 2 family protein [Gammaproteobacteria bacterium]|nr:nuclear transport factor 2 family protein [Gammaproteobacteria bacterium]
MNNYLYILLVALVLPANGCSRQDPQVASLPDFQQLVLKEYIEPYKTGDTEGWLEVFTDDAVGMHNTLPALEGKQALRRFAETVHGMFNIEQLDVTVDSVITEGDWALTRGDFIARFVPRGEDVENRPGPRQGKYILLWERQTDGTWKVILDMGNSNSP